MNSTVAVRLDSPVPPFEQVRAQFEAMIRSGELPDGARLPTVRALAGDLGLAAGTVARAYRELEAAGLIRTARRSGSTVVAPADTPMPHGGLPPELGDAVERLVDLSRAYGVGFEEISSVIRTRLEP
ncbi:GntR family transcriptional regulator [Arthrobacter sp. NPDC090010]|uniref:GntR family transcriptional regulator n=1 Tax=Arthrobacter sp. NPDC090010 TaxID=3363942 RepID=UPI0037F33199